MLGSIDRMLFQYLAGEGSDKHEFISGYYRTTDDLGVSIIRELFNTNFDIDCLNYAKKLIHETSTNDLIEDMVILMDTLNLHEFFEKDVLYAIPILNVKNYEEALVFIMSLVDNSYIMKGTLNLKDVLVNVFPLGFYSEEICKIILENLVHTNKVLQSNIYNKGMLLRT